VAEKAWSSITSYVPIVFELACKSSQRVKWPRKVELFTLDIESLWGLTTFDICGFRGVTSLALTTHGKALGFCHNYWRFLVR
jgi:hypothetical protein